MSSPLRWTEVRALAPEPWLELVADSLRADPSDGAAFGSPSLATDPPPPGWDYVRTFIESSRDTDELRARIRGAVNDLALRAGAPDLARVEVTFRELPPEDFASSWRKVWKPFRIGRLCVLPPWHTATLREGDLRLTLEPGPAFGTGRHPTTRTCLEVIQERVRPGARVLDVGCGSGILSVTAALFGASALGFDIDPYTLPCARDLAERNGVENACEFLQGSLEVVRDRGERFDAIVANIYGDLICDWAAALRDLLAPGGWFAFSGVSEKRVASVSQAIRAAGLQVPGVRRRGRWTTFVGEVARSP